RRDAGGWRRVPADGLEQQRTRHDADLTQLLGDDKPVLLIGDHQGWGEALGFRNAAGRLLEEAIATEQGQKLLRVQGARHRPKPCTRPTRQNDGMDHAITSWRYSGGGSLGRAPTYTVFTVPETLHRLCTGSVKKPLTAAMVSALGRANRVVYR